MKSPAYDLILKLELAPETFQSIIKTIYLRTYTLSKTTSKLPPPIKQTLEALDHDYKILRIIRNKEPRFAIQIQLQAKQCMLKTLTSQMPWKRLGRRLRFQKEIFIYSQFQAVSFSSFRHPQLLHTDGKSYIITEFIHNNYSLGREDSLFYIQAMKSILEFNTCLFPLQSFNRGWIWEKINRWKFSRSAKTLRNLIEGTAVKYKIPFSLLPRIFVFWGKAVTTTKKLHQPLLVHRDIFQANILRPEPDKIYFVDFEKAGIEKRWVFVDTLKIAQAEPLFFDHTWGDLSGFPRFYACQLQKFWEELTKRRPEINPEYRHFILQLKFCLLGWTLKKLVKETPGPQKEADLTRFLEQTVTGPEHYFEKWFSNLPRLPEP